MDRQYSKAFFHAFINSMQKLCRDYLEFDQAVEVCGYLSLEIDNSKKERYVLSELIQNAGDVISESYCVKAFKTVRRGTSSPIRKDENSHPFLSGRPSDGHSKNIPKEISRSHGGFMTQTDRTDYGEGNDRNRSRSEQFMAIRKSLNNSSGSRRSAGLGPGKLSSPMELLRVPQRHHDGLISQNALEAVPVQMFSSKCSSDGQLIPEVPWQPSLSPFSGSENISKNDKSQKRKSTADVYTTTGIKKYKDSLVEYGQSSSSCPDHSSSTTSTSQCTPHPQDDTSTEDLPIIIKEEGVPLMVIDPQEDTTEFGEEEDAHLERLTESGADNSSFSENEALSQLLQAHVAEDMNKHTSRKTRGHVKLFQEYLISQGINQPMQDIDPVELDSILGTFFWDVRKENGEEYEPSYLKNMQSSLERHLKHIGYSYCITRDKLFERSRTKLKEKQTVLFKQGKGNLPNKTIFLTDSNIDHLFKIQKLGDNNPDVLLNTMWLMVNVHFGMVVKNVRDHSDLLWRDIELKVDRTGREGLCLRKCPFHMVHVDDSVPAHRCFVRLYKTYRDNRARYNEDSCPFYLCPNPTTAGEWYKPSSAGVNRLNNMVRRIVDGSGLTMEKKYTNSSIQMLIRGPMRVLPN